MNAGAHDLRAAIGKVWIVSPVITAVLNRTDLSDYERTKLRELNDQLGELHQASYQIETVEFAHANPFVKVPEHADPDEDAKEAMYEQARP